MTSTSIKLLVDENVPKPVVKLLRELVGEDNVVWVAERLSLRGLSNSALVEYAESISAIVVTSDADFLQLRTNAKILYIKHEVAKNVALRRVPHERLRETLKQALETLSRPSVRIVKIVDVDKIEHS